MAGDLAAVAAAIDEGLEGDALGFYDVTLGESLIAAGDATAARAAFGRALEVRPGLPAALGGLAKLDAFDGDHSKAIGRLDTAIAAIPLPDSLARRADLLTLRGDPGDARQAETDRATVEAIAQLAGEAGSVYDRGLSLFLSDRRLEPDRAVPLARDELAVRRRRLRVRHARLGAAQRRRCRRRRSPMQSALTAGTRDARLWYHAGLIALANGRSAEAATSLRERSPSGPALDPVARARAPSRWRRSDEVASPFARPRLVLGAVLVPVVAGIALAHPLGNFTINHYAGVRVEPSQVLLDVVIDEAEIPTFQARQGFDVDGNGEPIGSRALGGASLGLRGSSPRPPPVSERVFRSGPAGRGRDRLPAGQRRAVDAAPRVHVRGGARGADHHRDRDHVP